MARSKIDPGSHGKITFQNLPDGRVRRTLCYRRIDGGYDKGRVRASFTAAGLGFEGWERFASVET
ncbi:hypothetical protein GCM10011313_07280 [Mycetocola zhadangensis]|nr:hypothetical protein GCM10011313_07280 [Mycetocola zhadangensis]